MANPKEIKFNTILVKFDRRFQEFQVPGLVEVNHVAHYSFEDSITYFTDDREDAIGTAKQIFGNDVLIQINRAH